MKNKKKLVLIIGLLIICILGGCGKNASESNNTVTMADEIAGEVSENAIPVEATVYTSISFNIPEGMIVDVDNTDVKAFYLAETSNDFSFVSYQRRDNSGNITCDTMTIDDFKNAFVDQLGVEPIITNFIREDKGDYSKISIDVAYSVTGINYSCSEYIYITDKYMFTLTYCQDGRFDWKDKYTSSINSISVYSVVGSLVDRTTPAVSTKEEVKDGVTLIKEEEKSTSELEKFMLDN